LIRSWRRGSFSSAERIPKAETLSPAWTYQVRMQEKAANGAAVKENVSAALLGAIVGYFVHQHWPSIEAIIHMIMS